MASGRDVADEDEDEDEDEKLSRLHFPWEIYLIINIILWMTTKYPKKLRKNNIEEEN